uniref:Uncharacterized protein n=1 Tax=Craspedostauros australis TaxID=1486917 RepID=A0A7R9WNG7_9STRA|mmetsp:Transcript_10962/g.30293  ORF Transcript_10962/g.30293 Transcript_10962/m.30293 type:complete len:202 (+) Transcript_10962:177-782(+)|eukprot:CAMPEP_0198116012 /NCGR_PEP_ID=MMETSP1442-20131203/9220_1 /TAXON_ID= /ORGANISM="Craspedostauros australis, Strain CCMP3328" /LENGTH=201 /DNA_ID=CAMNT_0043773685 /DNA_START=94 /DNA_END=699 /DNA_ORIENTATION=-
MQISMNACLLLALGLVSTLTQTAAFAPRPSFRVSTTQRYSTVIDAPTKEDIERQTRRSDEDLLGNPDENLVDAIRKQGPLEYLEDDPNESREIDDPFHILLLDQTYDKPKITVPYVTQSLEYVLDMPTEDASDHAQFCQDNGMSCLGTWSREECLNLGKQLQVRDLVCRVVPFCEGGQRPWQASKDAASDRFSNLRDAGFN